MNASTTKPSQWIRIIAGFALFFGLLTVMAGGRTLFMAEAQQQAGNIVSFVLWFNFMAGFAYMIAGSGLWRRQRWATWLSLAIAIATLLIFAGLGLYIGRGGSYEMRTVAAISLRSLVWLAIAGSTLRLSSLRKEGA